MNVTKEELLEIINKVTYKKDLLKHLGYNNLNSRSRKIIYDKIKSLDIDIDQLFKDKTFKVCPVCTNKFKARKNKQVTCSRSCANTYFMTGDQHPNWKQSSYRTTCFMYHKKKCVVCEEDKIVEVHHLDEDKNNNHPSNLIPLCPTHHQYWHSKFKKEIEHLVLNYYNNLKIKDSY